MVLYFNVNAVLPEWKVIIVSNAYEIINEIKAIFDGFVFEKINKYECKNKIHQCKIEIYGEAPLFELKYCLDETLVFSNLEKNELFFLLYDLFENYLTTLCLKEYSILHGSILALNDYAFGLVATTRTGKSTLTTYLSNKGFEYLADDHIIVNKNNNTVYPFRLPISLRSINHFDNEDVLEIVHEGFNPYRNEYNYLISTGAHESHHNSKELKSVFFLSRGDILEIQPLKKSVSYISLLNNIKFTKDFNIEVKDLIKFSKNIKCYNLFYDDLANAYTLIKKTIEQYGG